MTTKKSKLTEDAAPAAASSVASSVATAGSPRDDRCACGFDNCESIRQQLDELGHSDLATLVLSQDRAHRGRYIAGTLAMPVLARYAQFKIALYHYRDFSFESTDGRRVLKAWTVDNPDDDRWNFDKFSVAGIQQRGERQGHKINNPAGSKGAPAAYFPAPTRSSHDVDLLIGRLRSEQTTPTSRRGIPDARGLTAAATRQALDDAFEEMNRDLRTHVQDSFLRELGFASKESLSQELEAGRAARAQVDALRQELEKVHEQLKEAKQSSPMGMTIENMTSRQWWDRQFLAQKSVVMALVGLPNVDHLFKVLLAARLLFGDTDPEDQPWLIRQPSQSICDTALSLAQFLTPSNEPSIATRRVRHEKRDLSLFAEQVITLFVRRTGTSIRVCSALFGVPVATISRAQARWLPRLGGVIGRILSNLPFDENGARALAATDEHKEQSALGYDWAFSLDGKTVATEDVKIDPAVHRLQYSSKLSSAGATGVALIYHIGLPVAVTDVMMGRNSESSIVQAFAYKWTLGPWARILADRGFTTLYRHTRARVFLPAFKPPHGCAFAKAELQDSLRNAQERWKVETFFSRVASWRTCHHAVRRKDMHNLDSTWHLACGFAVFMKPLAQPSQVFFPTVFKAWCFAMGPEA